MKYLITGATGFVGRHIVQKLVKQNQDVAIIKRENSDISILPQNILSYNYDGSFTSINFAIKDYHPDVVIHLASLFLSQHESDDISRLIASNIQFGSLLLEAMDKNNCKKIVVAGTSWQHFNNEEYNPVNLYAATKQAFEDILRYYCEVRKFKAISLHLFDSYGPDDSRKKLICLLIEIAGTSNSLDMSPGEQEIMLIHVEDVCSGFIHATKILDEQNLSFSIYTLKNNDIMNLKKLVSEIESAINKKININWGIRRYRPREIFKLAKIVENLPGWTAQIKLSDGIRSLYFE